MNPVSATWLERGLYVISMLAILAMCFIVATAAARISAGKPKRLASNEDEIRDEAEYAPQHPANQLSRGSRQVL